MAKKINLVIDQGATFTQKIDVANNDLNPQSGNNSLVNLTGYFANAMMRKHYYSNTKTNFTANVNYANGRVRLTMNTSTTAALTEGRYVYDVMVTTGNTSSNIAASEVTSHRIAEGIVTVTPGVTR